MLALSLTLHAQSSKDIIVEALQQGVEAKVKSLQEEIKFTDDQAIQLIKVEMAFLKDVDKASRCFLCSKKKRIRKLQSEREVALQDLLTPGQYIRYLGGSIDDVKDYPVHL